MDSKPCTFCYNYIKDYGIKKIYYSNSDGTISKLNEDDVCHFSKGMKVLSDIDFRDIVFIMVKRKKTLKKLRQLFKKSTI